MQILNHIKQIFHDPNRRNANKTKKFENYWGLMQLQHAHNSELGLLAALNYCMAYPWTRMRDKYITTEGFAL